MIKDFKSSAFPITSKSIAEIQEQLLDAIGDASVVLIGESSHGTEEFYEMRAEITKMLITQKQFSIVAVEADFPDSIRVTNYVKGNGKDKTAADALEDFKRFPSWMWRNTSVVNFLEWLRYYNSKIDSPLQRIGFYGLDLYSLNASRQAVIDYLMGVDLTLAKRAKKLFACFDRFGKTSNFDTQYYAMTGLGLQKSCEVEAAEVLLDMNRKVQEFLLNHPNVDEYEKLFYAKVNAEVVKDSEEYYRNLFKGGALTWNIRDRHMYNTLSELIKHYSEVNQTPAKAIVWAHNSHIGDARETEVASMNEYNIGQLSREGFGLANTFNIGFSTFAGRVTAAHEWDHPPKYFKVNPGMKGSYEALLHSSAEENRLYNFLLLFRSNNKQNPAQFVASKQLIDDLSTTRYERVIGVVYRPDTERYSHYMKCTITKQFDALIYLDQTDAVEPLDHKQRRSAELDETFPTGL